MLTLPIQQHGRSFHFLVSSLISFFKVSKFLLYRSFTFLVNVTPRYFMLLLDIVKGDVSLISFSLDLSSVYSRATEFFELILYPATLLKVFISCTSSLVEFSGHLCRLSYHLQIASLTSSYSICIPLISFCCLTDLSRTSSTILKRYGESKPPFLVPDFRGITLSFSPFSLMLAVSLLYIAFIIFRYVPVIPYISKTFIMKGC